MVDRDILYQEPEEVAEDLIGRSILRDDYGTADLKRYGIDVDAVAAWEGKTGGTHTYPEEAGNFMLYPTRAGGPKFCISVAGEDPAIVSIESATEWYSDEFRNDLDAPEVPEYLDLVGNDEVKDKEFFDMFWIENGPEECQEELTPDEDYQIGIWEKD